MDICAEPLVLAREFGFERRDDPFVRVSLYGDFESFVFGRGGGGRKQIPLLTWWELVEVGRKRFPAIAAHLVHVGLALSVVPFGPACDAGVEPVPCGARAGLRHCHEHDVDGRVQVDQVAVVLGDLVQAGLVADADKALFLDACGFLQSVRGRWWSNEVGTGERCGRSKVQEEDYDDYHTYQEQNAKSAVATRRRAARRAWGARADEADGAGHCVWADRTVSGGQAPVKMRLRKKVRNPH